MNENNSVVPKHVNDLVDTVELTMIRDMVGSGEFEIIQLPTTPLFTPGLYSREIRMKPGSRLTSKIHKTEHMFVIYQGEAMVFLNGEWAHLQAPYRGVTKAGTRRILMIPEDAEEDCLWATFHPNPDNLTEDELEEQIIEKHDNELLIDFFSQNLIR